jgi:hypothetical protein
MAFAEGRRTLVPPGFDFGFDGRARPNGRKQCEQRDQEVLN